MIGTRKRLCEMTVAAALAMALAGCSDPNTKIPLTMNGWNDIRIGAPASTLERHIDENTISNSFYGCTSYAILKDVPRAMSVKVDNSTDRIIAVGMGGVAKVKTQHGLDLDDKMDTVRAVLGPNHQYIANADYPGDATKKANMGDLVIAWADPSNPGKANAPARGMRFENWRSNTSLAAISVSEFDSIGDSICG